MNMLERILMILLFLMVAGLIGAMIDGIKEAQNDIKNIKNEMSFIKMIIAHKEEKKNE